MCPTREIYYRVNSFHKPSFPIFAVINTAFMKHTAPYILMLEDDDDDRHITQTFFSERGYNIALEFFINSDDVLPYLEKCLEEDLLLPRLILLDKNVPASGGMEC